MKNISSTQLLNRCGGICEMCGSAEEIREIIISPKQGLSPDDMVVVCQYCHSQIESSDVLDTNHWRCLNESMWSPVSAVQVLSYRMLENLSGNEWAADLLSSIYLDDEILDWANYTNHNVAHMDSNGQKLEKGDSVVLVKDLDVKGANMVAKRGTVVKNIMLVSDNAEQIEGKVNDQQIVILTKFVRKA